MVPAVGSARVCWLQLLLIHRFHVGKPPWPRCVPVDWGVLLEEACSDDLSLEQLFDASADELERFLVRSVPCGRVGIDSLILTLSLFPAQPS